MPSQIAYKVARYIQEKRKSAQNELGFYKAQPSLEDAIWAAARSQRYGNRESHQRRIPGRVLERVGARLSQHLSSIEKTTTFEDLHRTTEYLLTSRDHKIRGVGPLTVYDVSHRIGSYLGLRPQRVFLHAGARAGARNVRVKNWRASSIKRSDLPEEFKELSAAECENCLCIYFTSKKRSQSVCSPRKSTC